MSKRVRFAKSSRKRVAAFAVGLELLANISHGTSVWKCLGWQPSCRRRMCVLKIKKNYMVMLYPRWMSMFLRDHVFMTGGHSQKHKCAQLNAPVHRFFFNSRKRSLKNGNRFFLGRALTHVKTTSLTHV